MCVREIHSDWFKWHLAPALAPALALAHNEVYETHKD